MPYQILNVSCACCSCKTTWIHEYQMFTKFVRRKKKEVILDGDHEKRSTSYKKKAQKLVSMYGASFRVKCQTEAYFWAGICAKVGLKWKLLLSFSPTWTTQLSIACNFFSFDSILKHCLRYHISSLLLVRLFRGRGVILCDLWPLITNWTAHIWQN